jgi:hypothetical protein
MKYFGSPFISRIEMPNIHGRGLLAINFYVRRPMTGSDCRETPQENR